MALIPATLITTLQTILINQASQGGRYTPTATQVNAINTLAADLGNAIDSYIRTATVNPGQTVVTAGTAAAQTGTTTSPGTLS